MSKGGDSSEKLGRNPFDRKHGSKAAVKTRVHEPEKPAVAKVLDFALLEMPARSRSALLKLRTLASSLKRR